MAPSQTQRPKFFEEQYLGAEDLTTAVDYARMQQARHALGAHTWGIAIGLQLKETPLPGGGVSVNLLPGYAWDGYGRPIVVLSPFRIPEEKFAAFTFDPSLDSDGKGRLIPIWLRYDERATSSINAGFALCDVSDQSSRIQETFGIEVGEICDTDLTSGVNIAGKLLADPKTSLKEFDPAALLVYDESIPHQDFPDPSTRARWLIPVGFARWLPVQNQPGHFVARDDSGADTDSDKIRRVRRYIGVVTEEIEAADGAIRLRNRTDDPTSSSFKPPTKSQKDNDLVWVEGNLRIEGDTRICGGNLDFRDTGGRDFDVPMRVQRSDVAPGDRALRVVIGPKAQTTNRFAVGVLDGANVVEKFVVLSGGNVGIGTTSPTDALQVIGDLRISGVARRPGGGPWTDLSDARLKKEIAPLTDALDLLLQLRGVSFQWKEPEKMGNLTGPQMGLVAQEVETVFPEWVGYDPEGYRELTVRGFEALAIEAMRELKAEVDDLKARLYERETQQRNKRKKPPAKN